MILEIQKGKTKILRRQAKQVANINAEIRQLCDDMIETMYASGGIGLAAPQVGISKSIIVVDHRGTPECYINPKIVDASPTTCVMEEGCLSFPETFEKIRRSEGVKVRYRNLIGRPMVKEFTGLDARIMQHEIDHLMGIVLLDYLH